MLDADWSPQELKKNFSWPNIKERRKRERDQANPQHHHHPHHKARVQQRDVREADVLKDARFRSAFVAIDEQNCGRVPER